jgi:hypothetical protein
MQAIATLENSNEEFSVQDITGASRQLLKKPFNPSHATQMLGHLAEKGLIYRNRRGLTVLRCLFSQTTFKGNRGTQLLDGSSCLFIPALCGGLFRNFLAPLGTHSFRPRLSAHAPKRHGCGVFAVIRHPVLDLADSDSSNHDGALVGVGGALFAFWTSRHSCSLMLSGKLRKRRSKSMKNDHPTNLRRGHGFQQARAAGAPYVHPRSGYQMDWDVTDQYYARELKALLEREPSIKALVQEKMEAMKSGIIRLQNHDCELGKERRSSATWLCYLVLYDRPDLAPVGYWDRVRKKIGFEAPPQSN